MSEFTINSEKTNLTGKITAYGYVGDRNIDHIDDFGNPIVETKSPFESPNVYAVKVEGDVTMYYARQNKRGFLYNPDEDGMVAQKQKEGKYNWQLKKTSSLAFDYYLHFLKTKNILWLRKATREN
jgi:hypothetical protein